MAITLRSEKGSPLSHAEMDGNFTELINVSESLSNIFTDGLEINIADFSGSIVARFEFTSASFSTRIGNVSQGLTNLQSDFLQTSSSFEFLISEFSGSISQLKLDSTSFSTRIGNVSSGFSDIQTDFIQLSSSLSFSVSSIKGILASLELNPDSINLLVGNLEDRISDLEAQLSLLSGSFQVRITNLAGDISLLKLDSASFSTRIGNVSSGFSDFQSDYFQDSSSFSFRISTVSGTISQFKLDSASFSTRIGNVSSGFSDFQSDYVQDSSSFSLRISNVSGTISQLKLDSASFSTRIGNLSGGLTKFQSNYFQDSSSFEFRISQASGTISQLKLDSQSFSTRIGSLSGSLTNSESRLTQLSNSFTLEVVNINNTLSSLNISSEVIEQIVGFTDELRIVSGGLAGRLTLTSGSFSARISGISGTMSKLVVDSASFSTRIGNVSSGFSELQTSFTQKEDAFDFLVANQDEILTTFNINTRGVIIEGSSVNIDTADLDINTDSFRIGGPTNFISGSNNKLEIKSDLFKLDEKKGNAEFSGSIRASGGSFDGTIFVGRGSSQGFINVGIDRNNVITLAGGADAASTKLYTGTGTYGDSNTPFYLDATGRFSLKDKLVFDGGDTLSISGNLVSTQGTIGGWTISSDKISSNNLTLDSSGKLDLVRSDASKTLELSTNTGDYVIRYGPDNNYSPEAQDLILHQDGTFTLRSDATLIGTLQVGDFSISEPGNISTGGYATGRVLLTENSDLQVHGIHVKRGNISVGKQFVSTGIRVDIVGKTAISDSLFVGNNLLYADNGIKRIGINTSAPTVPLDVNGNAKINGNLNVTGVLTAPTIQNNLTVNGGAVFNELGLGNDFRVEGDGNDYMLFVDGGNNRVGIGTPSPSTTLEVEGSIRANNSLTVVGGATVGGTLGVTGNTTLGQTLTVGTGTGKVGINKTPVYPLDVDGIGVVSGDFQVGGTLFVDSINGDLSIGSNVLFVDDTFNRIGINTSTPGAAFEVQGNSFMQGTLGVTGATTLSGNATVGGTLGVTGATTLSGNATVGGTLGVTGNATFDKGAVFNEGGGNFDFRVESDTNPNMFFVDASTNRVGVNTNTPQSGLHIFQTSGDSNGGIRLRKYNSVSFDWAIYINSNDNTLTFYQPDAGGGGYLTPANYVNNIDFTGQHRSNQSVDFVYQNYTDLTGLIVVSDGTYSNFDYTSHPNINEALPNIKLSDSIKDKRVFGVISDKEDLTNGRTYSTGNWVSTFATGSNDTERLIINSLGEGGMWVSNYNGNLENGDYITTSPILGLGMKQDDDLLHNYTVAKITQECTFDNPDLYIEVEYSGSVYRRQFVGVTYHCG